MYYYKSLLFQKKNILIIVHFNTRKLLDLFLMTSNLVIFAIDTIHIKVYKLIKFNADGIFLYVQTTNH